MKCEFESRLSPHFYFYMKYKIDGKDFEINRAGGVKGFLLWSEDGFFFRVHTKQDPFEFKDYKIDHCDLEVTIDAKADAAFYEEPDENYDGRLDYDPPSLGRVTDPPWKSSTEPMFGTHIREVIAAFKSFFCGR
jgi:hypothetical protein